MMCEEGIAVYNLQQQVPDMLKPRGAANAITFPFLVILMVSLQAYFNVLSF